MSVQTLSDFVIRRVLIIQPHETIAQAATIMTGDKAGSAIIADNGNLLGIITEHDMLRTWNLGISPDSPVTEIMCSPVLCVTCDMNWKEAYHLLKQKNIRHLVVTDHQDSIAGIVSETDFRHQQGVDNLSRFYNLTAELQAIFDQVGVFLAFLEPDGTVIKVNAAALTAAGVRQEDVTGKPFWEVSWWEHDKLQQEMLRRTIEQTTLLGKTTSFEATKRISDGSVISVDFTLRPILDANGQVVYLLPEAHDVTKRKLAEEAERSCRRHFEALVATTPVGVVKTDSNCACLYINQRALELTGLSQAEALGDAWIKAIHFDERQSLSLLKNATAEGDSTASLELRFVRPDKSSRWVLVQAASFSETGGGISGYIWTLTDITEMKILQEQLLLASSVYEASSEAILVTDAGNSIVAVNPGFTRITGYQSDEVIGHNPSILSSGRHTSQFYKSMWDALDICGHWEGEIWNRRKNGQVFVEWVSINTIRNKAGEVHRRFALFSDITEKKKSEELIWQQANYDMLTGLPNRRLFKDRLLLEMKRTQRAHLHLALLYIDLDRFKDVNDTLGHNLGDMLLIKAAGRISASVRDSDTVARLGGDEFTIILPNLSDLSRVEQVAQSINRALAAPFDLGNETIHISGSIGITIFPNDADNVETLIKNSDQAMYVAKDQGRNRFHYFTETMQVAAQQKLQLGNDLRIALAAMQLKVFYQPLVDLKSGKIVKAEALLRWQHPVHGIVNPAQFISIAEENGLINEIGEWVFRESARFAKKWSELRASHILKSNSGLIDPIGENRQDEWQIQISVNKSARQFLSGNTHQSWIHYLNEIDLPTGCMSIEITEGMLLDNRPEIAEKLRQFRELGIQVCLDDFGTGYSSMSYLKKFDIDYLKIDQSFVRNMETDQNNRAISEAIIAMAHKLGIKVIAEGVETETQREILVAAGCDYAQGHLFAVALPAEKFEALLAGESVAANELSIHETPVADVGGIWQPSCRDNETLL